MPIFVHKEDRRKAGGIRSLCIIVNEESFKGNEGGDAFEIVR